MAEKFKNVQILWASVREPYNYLQAKQLGCHIITVPPTTIEKVENFGKTFDQLTKETVKVFLVDSKKSRFKNLINLLLGLVAGDGFEPPTFRL